MNVKERILSIRLLEQIQKNKEFAKKLGVEIKKADREETKYE